MEEWIGRHFRSLALSFYLLHLFCPLEPPVELPVSVSYFRRIPATNGSVEQLGKRFPQRSAIVRDAEGQHSGIRMDGAVEDGDLPTSLPVASIRG